MKFLSTLFKIFLLALGLADFIGVLPDSLDIFDKGLTALILAFFWYQLNFSTFLFGENHKRSDRWLSKGLSISILVAFYILSMDSFVQLIRVIELDSQFVQDTALILSTLLPSAFISIKNAFLFLHNPAHATQLSLIFTRVGFSALIAIAIYAAVQLRYTKTSVMHSFTRLFIRKEESWQDFADTKGTSRIVKFLLSLLVLFSIYQYFFALVTQWFIVSLDKALFILAILYAVKDIQGTKSKALNSIGNFDNWLLSTIRDLFTDHKKFYFAFGILLIFHYLSDLATFFLPYLLGGAVDPFYLQYIGDTQGLYHQPLAALIPAAPGAVLLYILSTIGVICMILFPIILMYLILAQRRLHDWTAEYGARAATGIVLSCMILFSAFGWIRQVPLRHEGVQGVDFITQQIGGNIALGLVLAAALIIFMLFIVRVRRIADHVLVGIFLMSFSYFGYYVWNYFVSSWSYHTAAIAALSSGGLWYLAILLVLLLVLELLFYLGGFLLLAFSASRLIIEDIVVLNNRVALIWTGMVVIVPLLIMATAGNIALASTTIIMFVLFGYALFRHHTGKEQRDDYMLALSLIIAAYQFIVLLGILLSRLLGPVILIIVESLVLVALAYAVVRFFRIPLQYTGVAARRYLGLLLAAFGFALLFFILSEPVPALAGLVSVLIFTFLVACGEELLFRIALLYLGLQAFSRRVAVQLQAVFFALVHIVGIRALLAHYGDGTTLLPVAPWLALVLYVLALYGFSLVAARYACRTTEGKLRMNIVLPVLFHWLVNLLGLLLF